MTPAVAGAVLLAAVTHASWNAIAHRITDKLVGFTLISGGGALIGLAIALFAAFPAARAWPYLFTSSAIHAPRSPGRSREHQQTVVVPA